MSVQERKSAAVGLNAPHDAFVFVMPVHLRFQISPQHQESETFRVLQNESYGKSIIRSHGAFHRGTRTCVCNQTTAHDKTWQTCDQLLFRCHQSSFVVSVTAACDSYDFVLGPPSPTHDRQSLFSHWQTRLPGGIWACPDWQRCSG